MCVARRGLSQSRHRIFPRSGYVPELELAK